MNMRKVIKMPDTSFPRITDDKFLLLFNSPKKGIIMSLNEIVQD